MSDGADGHVLISMRDGTFVDEARLSGGTSGRLGALAGLDG